MKVISSRNSAGFTLIEVMVAIVILMIGALGLLQVVATSYKTNMQNQRREDVNRVAEEVMTNMRAQPFEATFAAVTTVTSKIRGGATNYRVTRNVSDITANVSKRYAVDVRWAYGNYSASHSIVTIRGKE